MDSIFKVDPFIRVCNRGTVDEFKHNMKCVVAYFSKHAEDYLDQFNKDYERDLGTKAFKIEYSIY
jgi:hypothetical protein